MKTEYPLRYFEKTGIEKVSPIYAVECEYYALPPNEKSGKLICIKTREDCSLQGLFLNNRSVAVYPK